MTSIGRPLEAPLPPPDGPAAPRWRIVPLVDTLDAYALGLSPAGMAVGWARAAHPDGHDAVRFAEGRLQRIGSLGGLRSVALAVNRHGALAGWSETPDGTTRAFVASAEQARALPVPRGAASVAAALNDHGQVAGWTVEADGLRTRAVLWQDDALVRLGSLGGASSRAHAINDAGAVVGEAECADGAIHAFVAAGGPMRRLPAAGRPCSVAYAVNGRLEVAGAVEDVDGRVVACLWRGGPPVELGTLGGSNSHAYGLNDAGWVVGRAALSDDAGTHAFAWAGGFMVDLNARLVDASGWELTEAWSINARLQIAGCGLLHGTPRPFRLDPILGPSP